MKVGVTVGVWARVRMGLPASDGEGVRVTVTVKVRVGGWT